jgi:hypothetical protein
LKENKKRKKLKKVKFFSKNLLTNGEVGAIISKVAQKAIIPSKNCKKISKK